jgi:hypothetical protein
MVASLLIIGFSLLLLAYWFRYSCILLLRSHAERAASASAVPDTRFCFAEVQARLRTAEVLDPLHLSLQRDYEILIYLLQHAAGLSMESFEDRLLVLDYKVMQWWYRLTRIAAPQQARQALYEMASILNVLAQKMGEQAGVQTEA